MLSKEEKKYKISIPIMTNADLSELDNIIDTNSDTIIEQITKAVTHEKDLIILQKVIEKQQAEIEKKDKIIDKMAEQLESCKNEIDILSEGDIDCFIPREFCDIDDCVKKQTCKQCIIEYFTNKVEEEK